MSASDQVCGHISGVWYEGNAGADDQVTRVDIDVIGVKTPETREELQQIPDDQRSTITHESKGWSQNYQVGKFICVPRPPDM